MRHEVHDKVSLEIARHVAGGLADHPEWLQLARDNLARWMARNSASPGLMRCYREWLDLLDLPVPEIRRILLDESSEGQRLRQNSPFAGVMKPADLWALKRRIWEDEKTRT